MAALSLLSLPNEFLDKIFSYLDPISRVHCASTGKTLYNFSMFFDHKWPISPTFAIDIEICPYTLGDEFFSPVLIQGNPTNKVELEPITGDHIVQVLIVQNDGDSKLSQENDFKLRHIINM